MTRHAKAHHHVHHHTFSTNFFGTIGYIAMVFVWLLVLDAFVLIASLAPVVADASSSVGSFTGATYVGATQTAGETNVSLQFLLVATLVVTTWVFCYMTARICSGVLKHMFSLFGRTLSLQSFTMAKYLALSIGLIGLAVLIQFVPLLFASSKLPLAFLGIIAGVVGVLAFWIQRILAERYRVALGRVL